VIAFSSPENPVLVVGGGPAGSTAARALALAGIPVCLLERAAGYPRNKPCGGGISMRALRRFPYLANALPRMATHELSRLYLEAPDGTSTIVESDEPAALMIRRVEFDAVLMSLAAEAGANVVTGVDIVQARQDAREVVLASRDGRTFRAPFVIAADGVHSVVARRLGLNPGWPASRVALDMMEETPRTQLRDLDPSTLWVSYGDGDGYKYIFPKRDHVNIGIGYVLDYFRREVGAAPYDLQRQFVAELRRRGIVTGESSREHFTPFIIPVGGPLARPAGGRVLLAGDAGGFVNGFTAEGIYYAMVSGELAARAIVDAAGEPSAAVARYSRACDREIGSELRDSVLIQQYLFADRDRVTQIVSGANRERAVTRLVLDLAIGRRSYRDVRRRILARSPLLFVRMLLEMIRSRSLSRPAASAQC
jgi:geranylgeranyl reductase family protein